MLLHSHDTEKIFQWCLLLSGTVTREQSFLDLLWLHCSDPVCVLLMASHRFHRI